MPFRGSYNFEVSNSGDIINTINNLELLRQLWLDREIITFEELGDGDPGDFDFGAWHVACHLVAATCFRNSNKVGLVWLEISYNENTKLYEPTLTFRKDNRIQTTHLQTALANEYLLNSKLLGFVEGTSEGRISARDIVDASDMFNSTPRQEYDQEPGSPKEGGRVWEHWCTTRDIRKSSAIGSSVLDSYLTLVAACGDKFVPTVARGRIDYYHPEQLAAIIKAGFTSLDSAQWNITPIVIPEHENLLLQEATPSAGLIAAEKLDWNDSPKYYMFKRRIDRWNSAVNL